MWSRFMMSQVKHNSYFLCGVALGLWVSLAVIPLDEEPGCAGVTGSVGGAGSAAPDEYEPAREERPLGPAGQAAGRSVQRPRYYTTELGMRGSLLTGVLSSEDALKSQVPALNETMALLQPALKFFITARAMSSVPGLANVVGFTDTREMLKPFHALKYLADNYLEEYDFFFLTTDAWFVNARRLSELVARLSVSQDLYMGAAADGDSHYCSLESGIILSNSVLRAVHGELDWCVRNSYSAHHHENVGRCVLHAAHLSCRSEQQGSRYAAVRLAEGAALPASLADAVSAGPAGPRELRRLRAHVAAARLRRARADTLRLRAELAALGPRHPPHARNASWPAGLRADPGLAPPPPNSRFDHLRWTLFNASHAYMPDEHRALAPLASPTKDAVELVVESALAWARRRWAWAAGASLVEGAWLWEPPAALRYRLVLALQAPTPGAAPALRLVEAARGLGAARLVPVRYVTESARVTLLLPVALGGRGPALTDACAFLQRYKRLPRSNTYLHVVAFPDKDSNSSSVEALLAPLRAALPPRDAALAVGEAEAGGEAALGRRAVRAVRARLVGEDALLLLVVPHLEFNLDFLNRVRMNTIQGTSWYCPLPFRRHALRPGAGPAPRTHSGRFNAHARELVAFYLSDLAAAEAVWRGGADEGVAAVLAGGALRGVVAPEPGAVLPPRPAPCPPGAAPSCRSALQLQTLDLGPRHALAQLLLEHQHEAR